MDSLESNKLVQFLMGLNDTYDAIRGQILLLEPLPNVSKAYSMILWVEKQREVNQSYINIQENNSLLTKAQPSTYGRSKGNNGRGRNNPAQNAGRGRGRSND